MCKNSYQFHPHMFHHLDKDQGYNHLCQSRNLVQKIQIYKCRNSCQFHLHTLHHSNRDWNDTQQYLIHNLVLCIQVHKCRNSCHFLHNRDMFHQMNKGLACSHLWPFHTVTQWKQPNSDSCTNFHLPGTVRHSCTHDLHRNLPNSSETKCDCFTMRILLCCSVSQSCNLSNERKRVIFCFGRYLFVCKRRPALVQKMSLFPHPVLVCG